MVLEDNVTTPPANVLGDESYVPVQRIGASILPRQNVFDE